MNTINFSAYETVTKKCLYINNDNKAVTHNKELYSLSEITGNATLQNFYIFPYFRYDEFDYAELYEDCGFVTTRIQSIHNWTIQELVNAVTDYPQGYTGKKELVQMKLQNKGFISVQDIKFAELAGEQQEYIDTLIQARLNFYALRQAQEEQEQQEKQRIEQEKLKEKQKKLDATIVLAEHKIMNSEILSNDEIEVYTTAGETETTLVLYLMKKYGIKVPLKTQGWINKALANLKFIDNEYSYNYYTTSKNSTVFRDYLSQLVQAIKSAYSVELSAQEVEQNTQKEEQKQYEESIPALNFKPLESPRDKMEVNHFEALHGKHLLSDNECIAIYKRIYKHIKNKNIEHAVNESMKCHRLDASMGNEQYRARIIVHYGNDSCITAKAFEDNGQVIILYYKSTNKHYYYKEMLNHEQNIEQVAS